MMNLNLNRKLLTVSVGLVCVLALSLSMAGAAYNAMVAPNATAVVDLNRLLDGLSEKQAMDQASIAAREQFQKDLEDRAKAVQMLESERDMFKQGEPDYEKTEQEMIQKGLELRVWREFQAQRIEGERLNQLLLLYRKTMDSIGGVADSMGYSLVIYKDPEMTFRGVQNFDQVRALIASRKLLWSKEDVDITDEVMQRMNNAYNAAP